MQNALNPSPDTLTPLEALRMQYAEYLGVQDFGPGLPKLTLWNLVKPIPGHAKHSTVSEQTLDAALRRLHPDAFAASAIIAKLAEFAQLKQHLE